MRSRALLNIEVCDVDYIGFINLLWCKSEWDTEFFHIRDQEVEQVLTSGESAPVVAF